MSMRSSIEDTSALMFTRRSRSRFGMRILEIWRIIVCTFRFPVLKDECVCVCRVLENERDLWPIEQYLYYLWSTVLSERRIWY